MATLQNLAVYGIGPNVQSGAPGGPVGAYPAPNGGMGAGGSPGAVAVGSPTVSAVGSNSAGSAPTFAWVAVVVAIVGIRVLYEMGAKLE